MPKRRCVAGLGNIGRCDIGVCDRENTYIFGDLNGIILRNIAFDNRPNTSVIFGIPDIAPVVFARKLDRAFKSAVAEYIDIDLFGTVFVRAVLPEL